MKIKSLFYVVFFAAVVLSCTPGGGIDDPTQNGGTGTEEPSEPSDPSDPSDPSEPSDPSDPSEPTEPVSIQFETDYVFADYNGGVESLSVEVDSALEWNITTSGEEWFSAERIDNKLVVTLSQSSDKLERKGTLTIKVGEGENVAEDSVVVWQIGTDTDELIYQVETTEPNQRVIAAPVLTLQNGGKMTADFGDGGEVGTYEGQRVYKDYVEPGIYTIIISGEGIHNLEFAYNDTICPELKRIISWGKMGYKNAANMCKGCINLESIPADFAGSFAEVGSFVAAFLGCEKLQAIPEGLFQHATKAKKFSNCFRYTASVSQIPENLFANNPLAEEFYYTFYGTGSNFEITNEALAINAGNYLVSYPAALEEPIANGKLRSIPEGLFAHNPNITRFEYIFGATAITSIPEKIFAQNSAATNYEGVCYACMNLASIPAKLMEKATAATNIKYMFAGCTSLTEIPVAMFENCTEVTNLEALFYLSTNIRSVKKDTFKGLSKVKTIGSVFQGCSALTTVEEGVFDGLTAAKSFPYCFADCTSLRTIPDGLLRGMTAAYEFESMFANTAIASVPANLFDEVRDYDLANYSYIFAECPNLKTVPATLFDHVTDVASDGFNCLFYKSGIETIPAGLFTSCVNVPATAFETAFMGCPKLKSVEGSIFPETTSVTSMKGLFYNCTSLESIPADLFKPFGTAKLKFSQTFEGCTSLKSIPEGLFAANTATTHFAGAFIDCTALESVPENLLASCANLTYVNKMFSGCTSLKSVPEKFFAGNPKIITFEETFSGCTALETIPEKLFASIGTTTTGITFARCFYGCSALRSLPAGLFDTVRRISFINSCFEGCTSLIGESPYTMIGGEKIHLYERVQGDDFPRIPSNRTAHEGCFKGCTRLSDYATMPEEWVTVQ